MIKLKIKYTSIFLLIAFGLASCIKEDRSDCPVYFAKANIAFEYYADGNTNVIGEYLNSVNLYVYNKRSGKLVKQYKFEDEEQLQQKAFNLEGLVPGDYLFIAWGNMTDETSIKDPEQISTAQIGSTNFFEGNKVITNDALYYSKGEFNLHEYKSRSFKMKLESANIRFEISVSGIAKLPTIKVDNLASAFDMNNNPVGTEDFSYHPHVAYDDVKNIYFTTFNVLRPKDLIDSKIQLSYPEGTSSFVQDVNEFIKNNLPQINLQTTQEILIRMHLVITESEITVTVPDWKFEDSGSGIE